MVRDIYLAIPPGMDVDIDNPIEDAALMAKVGAKRTCFPALLDGMALFELKNAITGTRFTFWWQPRVSIGHARWILQRDD